MDWAYLAGFTDGDGCITMETAKGVYRYSRIRWAQKESSSIVLDEIAVFLREHGIKISDRQFSVARQGHKYPQRELCVTNGADTRAVLHQLLPHLILKRPRALEALAVLDEVHELKQQYGRKYRMQMTSLGVAA